MKSSWSSKVIAAFLLLISLLTTSLVSSSPQPFVPSILPYSSNMTSSSDYDDEFNTPTLHENWYWQNEDPNRWSLTDSPGNLRIITANGDIFNPCGYTAKNILLQQGPTDAFEIETKLSFNPTARYHQAALLITNDNDLKTYIKVGEFWNPQLGRPHVGIVFVKDGNIAHRIGLSSHISPPVFLKIRKTGSVFTGYYSLDGQQFEEIDTVTTNDIVNPDVGVMAINSCGANPPDIPADFDYFHVSTVTGKITSPTDGITIGPLSLLFSAEASTSSPNGIRQVEFLVYYDGVWHSAGIDADYPYEVVWQTPAQLKSQQLRFGIHVTDNDDNITMFAGGGLKVNFVESIGNPEVTENWVPTRAYLNQRSLQPNGDSKCSAASMAMVLAMNGLISIDYGTMRDKANEIYPNVLNGNGDAYIGAMVAELERQEMTAETKQYSADNGWLILKQQIDLGRPVIVRTKHGAVTAAGHFFVAVGYRETATGHEVITYDPYGRWLGTCCTNNYDRNTKEQDSRKGQWVFYDFDDAFGNSNWLITAQPNTNVDAGIASDGMPASPPDVVSNEPENIGTYLGVDTQVDTRIYLPFVTR